MGNSRVINSLKWNMGCGSRLILDWAEIFGQYIRLVLTQNCEEFWVATDL